MRALSFAAVVFCALSPQSFAQGRKFPYEAVVVLDGAYVRSGPGEKKYYPTSRLEKGRRVRVFRHDPGGWYMIAPPEGSFSWVPKRYVRLTSRGTGEVTEEGVVAYVGTDFGSEASVFQRRLSVGQQIEILGEAQIEVTRERGPETMLKIMPPRREWRWLPGSAFAPADGSAREPLGGSRVVAPGADGTERRWSGRGSNRGDTFLNERPSARQTPSPRVNVPVTPINSGRTSVDPARLNADRSQLSALDARFRAIIEQPKNQWDFRQLESDYRAIEQNAAHPSIASQVKMRMPAIARYQRMKRRYDEFVSLTSATAQRDRQLSQMGSGVVAAPPGATDVFPRSRRPLLAAPRLPSPDRSGPRLPEPGAFPAPSVRSEAAGSANQAPEPRPIDSVLDPFATGTNPTAGSERNQQSLTPPSTVGVNTEPPPEGMVPVTPKHSRFAGAGVIRKSTKPGTPSFVLLTPNGQILAYLKGMGQVDLTRHVGYSMGIQGERFHSDKLKADFIRVRGLMPVRLRASR